MQTNVEERTKSNVIDSRLFQQVDYKNLPGSSIMPVNKLQNEFATICERVTSELPPGVARDQALFHLKTAELWTTDSIIHGNYGYGGSGGNQGGSDRGTAR